jgi:septal ring factor EnvC (AmiA/AmiB activator)
VQRVVKSSEDWTIIIRHGEYMSVYSNLSACHVSEGQQVKMRQSIGKIKEDIDGHCSELMFWIFSKNDAENPEAWLR